MKQIFSLPAMSAKLQLIPKNLPYLLLVFAALKISCLFVQNMYTTRLMIVHRCMPVPIYESMCINNPSAWLSCILMPTVVWNYISLSLSLSLSLFLFIVSLNNCKHLIICIIAKAVYLLNSLYVCMVLQCVMHVKADDIYGFVFVEIHNPPLYFLLRFPLMLRFHFSSRPQRLWQIH